MLTTCALERAKQVAKATELTEQETKDQAQKEIKAKAQEAFNKNQVTH